MTDFSKLLNPEQCAAATSGDGPILVLAAAGTGKTRTLVHRVAYLVEQGVDPGRILLLTFTNRAAREMLERAEKVVGPDATMIWSGTFHSVCARLLRRYGNAIGYQQGFQIIDDDDQKKLIGDIIKSTVANPKDFPRKEVVAKMISEAANECIPVLQVAGRWQLKAAGFEPEEIDRIAAAYSARKLELNAMDFDDLLVNGLRLLKESDRVRELLQEHFLHILVDEYQDTRERGDSHSVDIILDRMRSRMYDLSQFGKTFKETFGRIFRRRRPWCGNLWEGRFKSTLIGEAEYLRICTAYVELNPVRAGLSTSSSGYEWCTTGAAERGNAFAQRCRERLAAVAGFGDSPRSEGWLMKRAPQISCGKIFGSSEFVAESLGLLADRVKSHTARPRRIKGGEGFSSHGHLLAAKIERKAA